MDFVGFYKLSMIGKGKLNVNFTFHGGFVHGGTNVSMTLICKYLSWKTDGIYRLGFSCCRAGKIFGGRTTAALLFVLYILMYLYS